MSTGSIRHNIEITDSADAERFVEALEKAKAESEGVMERIVMEGTPLTLEERLERQANEIRTKEQQIEQLKAENDHWQEVYADLHIEYGEQIEAQQQEIKLLNMEIAELREQNQALKAYAENIEADKDAQGEKLKLMETVLKNARTALELLHHMNPEEFCFVFEVRCAIDALLGG